MGAAAVPLAIAGGSALGGVLGGDAQESAANTAAQSQQNIEQQQLAYLQQAGAQARGAIAGMEPYTTGASQAAASMTPSYLSPGQGAIFGGQQFNSNATSGTPDYSSLLSPQSASQNPAGLSQTPPSTQQAAANESGGGLRALLGLSGGTLPMSSGTASSLSKISSPSGGTTYYNASAPGSVHSALAAALANGASTGSPGANGSGGANALLSALKGGVPVQNVMGG